MLVAQSCLTLCDPMDCRLPGSSVHGILQARILEWVAIPFSWRSSWLRNQIQVSCIVGRFFTSWATTEAACILVNKIYHKSLFSVQLTDLLIDIENYIMETCRAMLHLLQFRAGIVKMGFPCTAMLWSCIILDHWVQLKGTGYTKFDRLCLFDLSSIT